MTVDTKPIRIRLISSVRPEPTSAGNIVLYRHLIGQPGLKVEVYGKEPTQLRMGALGRRLFGRLSQTPFYRWAEDYFVWNQGHWLDAELPPPSTTNPVDIVMTVAHGDACWAALRYARKHRLPLVTFFHDWWPDIPQLHAFARQALEKQFRTLYQESALALCVSEGMCDELGPHPNACILYPIPEKRLSVNSPNKPNRATQPAQFKVLYAGNLFEYGPMLQAAIEEFSSMPELKIEVRGAAPNWPIEFQRKSQAAGQWLDFTPRAELDAWFNSADAFLIPMVFDESMRCRMTTSFPSKLPEFAQFERPLIIWGPPYCSAAQWVKTDEQALLVNQDDPQVLVQAILELAHDKSKQRLLATTAKQLAATEFNPDFLQSRFVTIISALRNLVSCTDSRYTTRSADASAI